MCDYCSGPGCCSLCISKKLINPFIKQPVWCSHPVDQIAIEDKFARCFRCKSCGDAIIPFDVVMSGDVTTVYASRLLYSFHTTVSRIEF